MQKFWIGVYYNPTDGLLFYYFCTWLDKISNFIFFKIKIKNRWLVNFRNDKNKILFNFLCQKIMASVPVAGIMANSEIHASFYMAGWSVLRPTNGEALYWKIPMRTSVDLPRQPQDPIKKNLLGSFLKINETISQLI